MQSSSDEETEDVSNENPWQEVRSVKRKKLYKPQTQQRENVTLQNRYTPLTHDENLGANGVEAKKSIPKPPPIFVYGVVNLPQMIQKLQNIVETEQYTTRSLANNTVKINCTISDTYRKLVKFMNEHNIIYHTYQPKENRAYSRHKIPSSFNRYQRRRRRTIQPWSQSQKHNQCQTQTNKGTT
jgi:hypothetical protein